MKKEEWRPVVGYEELYEISNLSRVKSIRIIGGYKRSPLCKKDIILKQKIDRKGYCAVTLCNRGKKSFTVHKLVADAFLKKNTGDTQVNHKDGCKTNNNVSNLEWVTCSQNAQHAYDNNLRLAPIGEKCGTSKLTEKEVLEIRKKYATGKYFQKELADEFNIFKSNISAIITRRTWKHI